MRATKRQETEIQVADFVHDICTRMPYDTYKDAARDLISGLERNGLIQFPDEVETDSLWPAAPDDEAPYSDGIEDHGVKRP